MLRNALDGLTVIDFTQIGAGPTCTMLLADMGARVIKVEPPEGELGRGLGPGWIGDDSALFHAFNRNKLGVCAGPEVAAGRGRGEAAGRAGRRAGRKHAARRDGAPGPRLRASWPREHPALDLLLDLRLRPDRAVCRPRRRRRHRAGRHRPDEPDRPAGRRALQGAGAGGRRDDRLRRRAWACWPSWRSARATGRAASST